MSVLTGLQFPLTGAVTAAVTGGRERIEASEMVLSGFIGGTISGLVCGPMELVMIQQQRYGGGLGGTLLKIVRERGAMALMRGVIPACGREGVFTAGYLGLGPALSRELTETHNLSTGMGTFVGATGAGVVAGTLSHPMDTVKTCVQGDIGRSKFGSLSETATTLMKEGGAGAFFRGWSWRTGRMIGAVFVMGQCKDILPPLMFPHHFTDNS